MNIRLDVFSAHNIAGIDKVTVEELLKVEKEAKRFEEYWQRNWKNDEELEFLEWYRDVQYKVDWELKKRGIREMDELEKLFF